MEFGKKLRNLRTKKGLTQQEVADAVGITLRAYAAYELNNSRPRKRETYEALSKILDCDINSLLSDDEPSVISSLASGTALAGSMTALFGIPGVASSLAYLFCKNFLWKKKENPIEDKSETGHEAFQQFEKAQRQFRSVAWDLIITELANKNVDYRVGNMSKYENDRKAPEKYIVLEGQNIDEWWFYFWPNNTAKDESISEHLTENVEFMFSGFAFLKADAKRKISVVVDNQLFFDEMCRIKDSNSYRGNLSVILIDTSKETIDREETICGFDETKPASCISVI